MHTSFINWGRIISSERPLYHKQFSHFCIQVFSIPACILSQLKIIISNKQTNLRTQDALLASLHQSGRNIDFTILSKEIVWVYALEAVVMKCIVNKCQEIVRGCKAAKRLLCQRPNRIKILCQTIRFKYHFPSGYSRKFVYSCF